jgi:hypothetical protein
VNRTFGRAGNTPSVQSDCLRRGRSGLLQRRRKITVGSLWGANLQPKRLGKTMRSRFRLNRTTPQMLGLAKDLIAYETSGEESSQEKPPAVFSVTEKLCPHLANLMGIGDFRALLSPTLVLAAAEVSWLSAVHVKADGTLEGFGWA